MTSHHLRIGGPGAASSAQLPCSQREGSCGAVPGQGLRSDAAGEAAWQPLGLPAEETLQSLRVHWLLLWLKVSSGLLTDPWIDVGKERAGFGFAAVHQFHFRGISSLLHLPVVVVTEFKKPIPKAASNTANAVRSRG